MAANPPKPADRATVLAWIDAGHGSYHLAAKHFGLNVGTVKSWLKRRPHGAPTVPPTLTVAGGGRTPGLEGGAGAPSAKPAPSKARLDLDNMEPGARRSLQSAIVQRLDWLADKNNIEADCQRDVAVVVGILVDKAPGILDAARMQDGDRLAGPTDEDAALLESALFPPAEAPVLTVVEARRA